MLTSTPNHCRVRRLSVLLLAAATAGLGGGCAPLERQPQATNYCAIMPDSVGLYVNNPVTQMGYPIGKVTAITPETTSVRVDFTVSADRKLPADVRAVTRSTSILADRTLELVGNPASGAQLATNGCIPLDHSSTPKSLSEVIGSATKFVNAVNPDGSTNVGDVVTSVDQVLRHNGANINQLLTTSSKVLDNADQAIGDLGSVVTNLAELTSTVNDIKDPLKQVLLDAEQTTPDMADALIGGVNLFAALPPLITMASDIEVELGPNETQQTLDAFEYAIRKASAHTTFFASLLKPFPVLVNWLENHANNKQLFTLRWRPPMYRVRSPDGLLTCGLMNASAPGSCADVNGMPYSVDIDLLQYVLTEASRR